ncbi:MAG TPA: hypothetical protein VGP70_05695 [Actinomadura sp.]|jgi:hypothetical protein|nr:hypothetical protein [Actinomadura sp.]
MIRMLRKMGVSSSMLYTAGFGSIAISACAWALSQGMERTDTERADRWGIFIGEWAPTLFALGNAMRLEEQLGEDGQQETFGDMKERARGAMPVG